jgi:uncharacterized protein
MTNSSTHHIVFYEYIQDMAERRGPYREAHLTRIREAKDAGRIVMAGALGDPPHGGALVFRDVSPDDIEAFVAADPYMTAGLITAHRVERWNLV